MFKKRGEKQPINLFDLIKNDANEYSFLLYLKNGGDPNVVDEKTGNSLLHLAIMHGRKTSAMRLIECGADVHYVNRNGYNALHIACGDNLREEIVATLLDKGVDVNAQTNTGYTALMSSGDNSYYVALILKKDVNLNLKDQYGRTALDIIKEYPDCIAKQLIESAYEDYHLTKLIDVKPEATIKLEF